MLDSLDNLVKNGRISRTVALLANVLSIRLLMSDGGHGAIKNISKARGIKGRAGADGGNLPQAHRGAGGRLSAARDLLLQLPGRARQVRDMIREKCPAIGEIILTPTSRFPRCTPTTAASSSLLSESPSL